METATAVDLINNHLIYKPGWVFTAEDWEKRFQGTVKVRCTYPARNSNSEWAPDFAQRIRPYADVLVPVGTADTVTTLFHRLITLVIMVIEEHEAREFLMYKDSLGSYFPLLHPHITATMQAWGRESLAWQGLPVTASAVAVYMNADQTFGVA